MTAHLTAVNAGDGDDGTIEEAQARAIAAAVAVQFGDEGLTAQLATLTTQLTRVTAGENGEDGEIAQDTAGQIQEAVEAVQETMDAIGNLKGAEGLSDTVVDAIGILENAWEELSEVQLGNRTVGNIPDGGAAIANVTQEQVGILKEVRDIDYTVN